MTRNGPQDWQIQALRRRLAVEAALKQRRDRMRAKLDELWETIGLSIGEVLGHFRSPDTAITLLQALADSLEDEHVESGVDCEETERALKQLRGLVDELDEIDTALLEESKTEPENESTP